MIVRRLDRADVPAIAALDALCFGCEAWSADQLAGSLALATTHGLGLCEEERLTGFALVQRLEGEAEILTLGIDPARQRQGLGERLLHEILALAVETTVFLEVAADNTAAIRLYEKAGFRLFGRRPAYYNRSGDKIDALTYRYLVNDKG